MKADLPRPLHIPAWVPEPIAQFARTNYAGDVHRAYARAIEEFGPPEDAAECDDLAALDEVRVNYIEDVRDDLAEIAKNYRPLVSDPRMRGVWHELSRRRNGGFLHPACGASTQEAAVVKLFELALTCRKRHWTATTRGEVERWRRHFLARAEELEDDALTMLLGRGMDFLIFEQRGELGRRPFEQFEQRNELWQKLKHAADACKEYAHALDATKCFILKREHDSRARQLALAISAQFRVLFGSPMYGLTATITSVVLGRQINSRQTEQWCASHSPVKTQKISS
jgi:hypothetical protein